MGARFSKVSCTCTINCHQPGAVHDHSNGVGPCQRCNHLRRLRAGAQSRASAASSSTEYLARPRYHASPSPDPDLARHLIPHPTTLRRRAPAQQRTRRRRRAVSYPDTLPSFISTTTPGLSSSSNPSTNPSLRPNRSLSPSPHPSPDPTINHTPSTLSILSSLSMPSSTRVRRNTVASFALGNIEAASWRAGGNANANNADDDDGGVPGNGVGAAAETSVSAPSDISQSSTAVCCGSEEGGMEGLGMGVYGGEEE